MRPFVRARLGPYGKPVRTLSVGTTDNNVDDADPLNVNPQFDSSLHNELILICRSDDEDSLIVEVIDERDDRDSFIGSCHEDLKQLVALSETSDSWQPVTFQLYDQQAVENDLLDDPAEHEAGTISAVIKWVSRTQSSAGELRIRVLTCSNLRNISTLHVSDCSNYVDKNTVARHVALASAVFLASVIAWICVFALLHSWTFLDSTLFVVTTLTTGGSSPYGDSPKIATEQIVRIGFVVAGPAVVGLMAGVGFNLPRLISDRRQRDRFRTQLLRKALKTRQKKVADVESGLLTSLETQRLKRKYPGAIIDAQLLQRELGATISRGMLRYEIDNIVVAFLALSATLLLGAALFFVTERNETHECTPAVNNRRNGAALGGEATEADGSFHSGANCSYSFLDALYFSTLTACTIGDNASAPKSMAGRIFAIPYVLVSVVLYAKCFVNTAHIPIGLRHFMIETHVLDLFGDEITAHDFADMKVQANVQPEASIRKNDFIVGMLMRLGRVGKYDIERIGQVFEQLDTDNNGELDAADLQDLLREQRRRMARLQPIHGQMPKLPTYYWNPETGTVLGPRGGGDHRKHGIGLGSTRRCTSAPATLFGDLENDLSTTDSNNPLHGEPTWGTTDDIEYEDGSTLVSAEV